ncbi:beta-lactamase/transpeptidase-like protein [Penicillium chermesinum]|nr:beta-lactamase/transpeptidase-like protein [Penicillium chermesinum]
MAVDKQRVKEILDDIALRYRGPGGAIAVLKDGEVIGQRVWGYADLDQLIPMEPQTQMPICSISKQFVCALLLDLQRNPPPAVAAKGDIQKQFSEKLAELLQPDLIERSGLKLEHLHSMQSGLRDYWAMTTLWGVKPDGEFLIERDCPPALARTKSTHFEPGAEFSYCNINFHALGQIIERVTGEPLGKLLKERILDPAGMDTAFLCPNTARHPPPCVGYEGSESTGYVPAVNRMEWAGDAGIVASLNDMISYEKYLDRLFGTEQSWYRTAIEPKEYSDGAAAPYNYGLAHVKLGEVDTYGHGGALRGYRIHRRHAPHERLSAVVFLNHEAAADSAVADALRGILDIPKPAYPSVQPDPAWFGSFLDEDSRLTVTVTKGWNAGDLTINYEGSPETIKLVDPKTSLGSDITASIDGDVLKMHRVLENRKLHARRLVWRESAAKDESLKGTYRCEDVDSVFHCTGEAGMLYGVFEGYLG